MSIQAEPPLLFGFGTRLLLDGRGNSSDCIAAAPDDVKAVMLLRLPDWRISGRQIAGAPFKSAKFFQIGDLAPRL
jgi:hypothetical protein